MGVSRTLEDTDAAAAVASAFVAGVMVGMVAGFLLAPEAGDELRRSLKAYAAKAVEDVLETAMRTAQTYADDLISRGKEYIENAVEEIREPIAKIGASRGTY